MSVDVSSNCRTCLSASNTYHQLFDYVDDNYKILDMLDGIVPQIDVKNSSSLSTIVCMSCVDKLLAGYKFQQLCIETNKRLHEFLAIGVSEADTKLDTQIRDATSLKIKQEIEEEALFEKEIPPDELKVVGIFDESYCNKESSLKEDLHVNLEEIPKTIVKEEIEITSQMFEEEFVGDAEEDISEEEFIAETETAKETKNTNVETGIGEIEKPNMSNKRKRRLPCEICGKVFDRLSSLKRHGAVHSLTRPHECHICNYRFSTINILKAHLFQHENKTGGLLDTKSCPEGFKCPDCPRRFEKQGSLWSHRQIHKRNAMKQNYPCTICQRNFIYLRSLTEHVTNEHPEVEKHKCDQCDETFVVEAHLTKHLNLHKGNRNLVCLICEKEIVYPNTLKEHMSTHSGESSKSCKTYRSESNQCPECPSSFNCKLDLMKHTLQKHKLSVKQFKCDQCNMSFAVIDHLRRHLSTHTGEKFYKCKFCERSFVKNGSLTKHLKTHVGENTYICDQCPMAFKYKAELRKHQSHHKDKV